MKSKNVVTLEVIAYDFVDFVERVSRQVNDLAGYTIASIEKDTDFHTFKPGPIVSLWIITLEKELT